MVCMLRGPAISRTALVAAVSAWAMFSQGTLPAEAQQIELPAELASAAEERAAALTNGEQIGGSVSVLGVNGGHELEMLKAAWKPFEDATGIRVDYNGTTDFAAVLQTRVQAGDPPDLAGSTNISNVLRYAGQGALQDIGSLVPAEALDGAFVSGLADAVTVDGEIYGVWTEVNNFMLWYNANLYDGPKENVTTEQLNEWVAQAAEEGLTPWCYADERGASSGYIGANWIQSYILKNSGPEVLEALGKGDQKWNSPEVRAAWEAFGSIVHDPQIVMGGAMAGLSTPAIQLGAGLFADPPYCALMQWGTYAGSLTLNLYPDAQPVEDLDFMRIPGVAGNADFETFGGTVYMAFKDTPQIRAFLTYLATPEAQRLVAANNNWTVASAHVGPEAYTNPLLSRARETLLGPDTTLVTQPTQVAQPPVIQAFIKGVVAYALDPGALDGALDSIDAAVAAGEQG